MKNRKISSKITISFVLVNAIYIVAILASLWSYSLSNTRLNNMHQNAVQPEIQIGEIRDAVLRERVALRQLALLDTGSAGQAALLVTVDTEHQKVLSGMTAYRDHSTDDEEKATANEFLTHYKNTYLPCVDEFLRHTGENNIDAAVALLPAMTGFDATIDDKLDYFSGLTEGRISFYLSNATFGFVRLLILAVVIMSLVLIMVIYIVKYMNRLISHRIGKLSKTAELLSMGILDVEIEQDDTDEIGQLSASFASMVRNIKTQVHALVAIAEGDLTVHVVPQCDDDTMGNTLKQMIEKLNEIFLKINVVSNQLAASSEDIAQSARSLALGSTEQATTVEEINCSVAKMNENSSVEIDTADLSVIKTLSIRDFARDGSKKMEKLMDAIQQISDASRSIGRVIKVIDDIAFQTNILALNAAVEAARAGVHGKGFAVVAEEVRNLSGKSAKAAQETAILVNENIEKTELGRSISRASVESLDRIVESIQAITTQLNESVGQVSRVVQQISTTSQQSAAASQELSGHAQMLRQLVSHFRISASGHSAEHDSGFAVSRQLSDRSAVPNMSQISNQSNMPQVSSFPAPDSENNPAYGLY